MLVLVPGSDSVLIVRKLSRVERRKVTVVPWTPKGRSGIIEAAGW